MPSVVVTDAAMTDLDRLIEPHELPSDTRDRVKQILEPLRRFPEMGGLLGGRWEGARFLLGPWSWMLLVYRHVEDLDLVAVTTIQDARRVGHRSAMRRPV